VYQMSQCIRHGQCTVKLIVELKGRTTDIGSAGLMWHNDLGITHHSYRHVHEYLCKPRKQLRSFLWLWWIFIPWCSLFIISWYT